jgi:hypothetical protein
MPPPLDAQRPTFALFGVGLVLAPQGVGQPMARLELRFAARPAAPLALPRNPALRPLMAGNPAARALPLLEALALGETARLELPYLDASLAVTVTP